MKFAQENAQRMNLCFIWACQVPCRTIFEYFDGKKHGSEQKNKCRKSRDLYMWPTDATRRQETFLRFPYRKMCLQVNNYVPNL